MLHRVSNVLDESGIANAFCQGNVYCRNNAIKSFRGEETRRRYQQHLLFFLSLLLSFSPALFSFFCFLFLSPLLCSFKLPTLLTFNSSEMKVVRVLMLSFANAASGKRILAQEQYNMAHENNRNQLARCYSHYHDWSHGRYKEASSRYRSTSHWKVKPHLYSSSPMLNTITTLTHLQTQQSTPIGTKEGDHVDALYREGYRWVRTLHAQPEEGWWTYRTLLQQEQVSMA